MTVVVDASLAIKWVVEEEYSQEALDLRDYWYQDSEPVVAPPIFRPEVTNVLRQKVRRRELSQTHAANRLDLLITHVAIREPLRLYSRGLALAGDLCLGSAYDALYLALAEFEDCDVWTADLRLVRVAQAKFPRLRWVAEKP